MTQAKGAVEKNRDAAAKEDVEMAWAGATTQYWTEWANDSSKIKDLNFYQGKLLGNSPVIVPSGGKITSISAIGNKYLVDYKEKEQSISYQFIIDENGKATIATFATMISPENYGDSVDYEANGVTDWKIFYSDGNHIFLITSDYLNTNTVTSKEFLNKANLTQNGNYVVYWNSAPDSLDPTPQASLFRATTFTLDSTSNTSKMVSKLLNTENWEDFKDASGFAEFAIGAPSLEMFLDSWNDTHPDEKYDFDFKDNNYCRIKPIGYEGDYYATTLSEHPTLYFPHYDSAGHTWNSCYGYYLSLPYFDWGICNVSNTNGQSFNSNVSWTNKRNCLRPVVALNSKVKATKNNNDVWELNMN